MDAPYDIDAGLWAQVVNTTIKAIRAQSMWNSMKCVVIANDWFSSDATNLILVPGVEYSQSQKWADITSGKMFFFVLRVLTWFFFSQGISNADALLSIYDPANNTAFEVQTWFDADGSGLTTVGSYVCITGTIGSLRLKTFTEWLRANGKLGEFSFGTHDC
jgi:endoglucanase